MWILRSVWMLDLFMYLTFAGANMKGTLSRIMGNLVKPYFLFPGEVIFIEQKSKNSVRDYYLGKFTARDYSPFMINQCPLWACFYILMFISALLPLGSFKKYVSRVKISVLLVNWLHFIIFSVLTLSTQNS